MSNGANVAGSDPAESGQKVMRVPIGDTPVRMLLVTQLVAWLDGECEASVAELERVGMTSSLVERLRSLSATDAMRLAALPCGLSISVESTQIDAQLERVERMRSEKACCEAFIAGGASSALVARLFGVSEVQIRRRRRQIAPHLTAGGRPRLPAEVDRLAIEGAWNALLARTELTERDRWMSLHASFNGYSIVTLEDVVARLRSHQARRLES